MALFTLIECTRGRRLTTRHVTHTINHRYVTGGPLLFVHSQGERKMAITLAVYRNLMTSGQQSIGVINAAIQEMADTIAKAKDLPNAKSGDATTLAAIARAQATLDAVKGIPGPPTVDLLADAQSELSSIGMADTKSDAEGKVAKILQTQIAAETALGSVKSELRSIFATAQTASETKSEKEEVDGIVEKISRIRRDIAEQHGSIHQELADAEEAHLKKSTTTSKKAVSDIKEVEQTVAAAYERVKESERSVKRSRTKSGAETHLKRAQNAQEEVDEALIEAGDAVRTLTSSRKRAEVAKQFASPTPLEKVVGGSWSWLMLLGLSVVVLIIEYLVISRQLPELWRWIVWIPFVAFGILGSAAVVTNRGWSAKAKSIHATFHVFAVITAVILLSNAPGIDKITESETPTPTTAAEAPTQAPAVLSPPEDKTIGTPDQDLRDPNP